MHKLLNRSSVPLVCRISGRAEVLPPGTEDSPGVLMLEDFKEADGYVVTSKAQADKHISDHSKYGVTAVEILPPAPAEEAPVAPPKRAKKEEKDEE